jgi:hypothetical protein
MDNERTARGDAMYCPACGGLTKSWVIDQSKEQQDLHRLQAERSQASQKSLEAFQQSRLAQERLTEAQREVKRCQGRLSLTEANYAPGSFPYQQAQRNLLAAEQDAAAAMLARDQAKARVQALGG